jgi:hypothetical protein
MFWAETEESMSDEHFVYCLVDPRNNEVFYVGKGTGTDLEKYGQGNGGSSDKDIRIDLIRQSGQAVKVQVMRRFSDEISAFRHKYRAIHDIPNLTNSANEKRMAEVMVVEAKAAYQAGLKTGGTGGE